MKKAFSLAEVLTTLLIIGVVAMITIPSLFGNTNDQKVRSSRKVVAQKLVDGFSQMRRDGALGVRYESTEEFVKAMGKYFNIKKTCKKNELDKCFSGTVYSNNKEKTANAIAGLDGDVVGVKLSDGSALLVKYNPNGNLYDIYSETEILTYADGKDMIAYPVFGNLFEYVFDSNEGKNPNTLGKDIIGNLQIGDIPLGTGVVVSSQTDIADNTQDGTSSGSTSGNTTNDTTNSDATSSGETNNDTTQQASDNQSGTPAASEPDCGELTKKLSGTQGIAWYYYNGADADSSDCKAKIDAIANDEFCEARGYVGLEEIGNMYSSPYSYAVSCCTGVEPCSNSRYYFISVKSSGGGGSVTSDRTKVNRINTEAVTLTATGSVGMIFSRWNIQGGYTIINGDLKEEEITIIPSSDIFVTAKFDRIPSGTGQTGHSGGSTN